MEPQKTTRLMIVTLEGSACMARIKEAHRGLKQDHAEAALLLYERVLALGALPRVERLLARAASAQSQSEAA